MLNDTEFQRLNEEVKKFNLQLNKDLSKDKGHGKKRTRKDIEDDDDEEENKFYSDSKRNKDEKDKKNNFWKNKAKFKAINKNRKKWNKK